MGVFFTKRVVTVLTILAVLGIGGFAFVILNKKEPVIPRVEQAKNIGPKYKIIGTSVEGRKIESYTYGNGKTSLLFIGGMHGGYEWNSVLLADTFMDYLEANPNVIPSDLIVTIIPSANPDGVYKIIGKEGRFTSTDVPTTMGDESLGRFNAHNVDLNRNFDCKWKPESMWKNKVVSAGTTPFSEPEAKAIRDFVLENHPAAAIFWHSQANAVYASECEKGILPQTLDIMNTYSKASGYPAVKSFDSYAVTGDSEGWLASINIPAITVELQTHKTIEWERNLAGIKALFDYYSRKIVGNEL
ncbi:MAG: M14 family metallopeptidase [bacterium]|nr:M14 family metallopeptidase [bacterium]